MKRRNILSLTFILALPFLAGTAYGDQINFFDTVVAMPNNDGNWVLGHSKTYTSGGLSITAEAFISGTPDDAWLVENNR